MLRPRFLAGRASTIWDEYAPELIRLGVLTSIDAHQFAVWCCLMAEFEENPTKMLAAKIAQMRGLAASFGMESSARTRLGMPEPLGSSRQPEQLDPFEEFMRGRARLKAVPPGATAEG